MTMLFFKPNYPKIRPKTFLRQFGLRICGLRLWVCLLLACFVPLTNASTPNGQDKILALYQKPNYQKPSVLPIDNLNVSLQPTTDNFYNQAIASYSLQKINQIPQIHDPWVADRIYELVLKLSQTANRQTLLAVPVINDKSVNAFAVPGGLIGINTGTILTAQNMDELASVVAHEVAHLSLRHYERTQDDKSKLVAMQIGGLLTALAVSAVSGDVATATMIGTQALGAETRANASRNHEREADRVGMQILAKAGFDVRAMPRFFTQLQHKISLNQSTGYLPSFAQSHPFTMERLSEAQSRSLSYPPQTTSQLNRKAFDLLYWRVAYLTQADQTTLQLGAKTSVGAKLAYVAYLADKRRFDDAKKMLDSVASADPAMLSEPLYCITNAHIAYEKTDFKQAVQILSACHTLYPERRDLSVYLADSLIFDGNAHQAIDLLQPLITKTPHDIVLHDLRQKAYEHLAKTASADTLKNQYTTNALMARADKELWQGQFDNALSSLHHAKITATDTTQIDTKMATVQFYQNFKP